MVGKSIIKVLLKQKPLTIIKDPQAVKRSQYRVIGFRAHLPPTVQLEELVLIERLGLLLQLQTI